MEVTTIVLLICIAIAMLWRVFLRSQGCSTSTDWESGCGDGGGDGGGD
jgi:hypothetical protein